MKMPVAGRPDRLLGGRRLDRLPVRARGRRRRTRTTSSPGKDCGTGPYTLKSYNAGSAGRAQPLPATTGAAGRRTATRTSSIEITPEAIVQQQMLTSGQIDLALDGARRERQEAAVGREVQPARAHDVAELRRLLQHDAAAARQRPGPAGALVRDAVRRHHQGRRATARARRPRGPVPEGHLPVDVRRRRSTTRTSPRRRRCWRRPAIPAAASR